MLPASRSGTVSYTHLKLPLDIPKCYAILPLHLFLRRLQILNIAIIDDIASDAEQLKRIITFYFENRQIPTEIRYFSSAEAFFDDYRPGNFQILFLDIYMEMCIRDRCTTRILSFG